ncbi:sugar phosphate nucleotidyltransferase [Paenibacillus chitinolyticus]|uniref:sugar phosphate nucleotidyltransferase n=1 Tax=Paenibacillus chitinolyticus TaxID=79263 RepID=UPI0035592CD7
MKIILLSGGSGKRLWPLSNEIRSKTFLKLLPAPDGGRESMLQRVCRQLDAAGLLSSTSIVTHFSQFEIVRSQVGEKIPVLAEPHKRGTFTAIGLASRYLHTQGISPDEIVCFMPADPFVDAAFFEKVASLPSVLARSGARMALIGTKPSFPSTQYGYIVPASAQDREAAPYLSVAEFAEKPDEQGASALLSRGALWNSGVFAFANSFMLEVLASRGLPDDYGQLLGLYDKLPELGFDEEVVEKTKPIVVLPYDGRWDDLGNWQALAPHLEGRAVGPGEVSDDSADTHIVNELSSPVHVIGVSGIIVAASPDGILVASKAGSSRIKQINPGKRRAPMYEEYRWGTVTVLDRVPPTGDANAGTEVVIRRITLLPGKSFPYRAHGSAKKSWTLLSGSGQMILDGRITRVKTGDVLHLEPAAGYALLADTTGPVELIEIEFGPESAKPAPAAPSLSWEEAVLLCRNDREPDPGKG